mmetsp:Transcript_8004/g.11648  ORF Transcript_8004/g.11648 Transcript_8004/m.11648 type:complete len:137 (-) Transcript_8004:850-1260(-)
MEFSSAIAAFSPTDVINGLFCYIQTNRESNNNIKFVMPSYFTDYSRDFSIHLAFKPHQRQLCTMWASSIVIVRNNGVAHSQQMSLQPYQLFRKLKVLSPMCLTRPKQVGKITSLIVDFDQDLHRENKADGISFVIR